MGNKTLLSVLFLLLISKQCSSFTFLNCEYYYIGENDFSKCNDPYPEEDFNAEFIKNLEYDYIIINMTNLPEVALNFDGLSSKEICFINVDDNAKLIIQTYDWFMDFYSQSKPSILANDLNVIIENLNNSVTENLFILGVGFYFKTISSKDPKRPLHLIDPSRTYAGEARDHYDINSFNDSTIYTNWISIKFPTELDNSKTLILQPARVLSDYELNHIYDECLLKAIAYEGLKITSGKNKITIEFPGQKTLTVKITTMRTDFKIDVYGNTIITCEDGLSENDVIFPIVTAKKGINSGEYPLITGNWPSITSYYIDEIDLGNGFVIGSFSRNPNIYGTFNYAANSFPIYKFEEAYDSGYAIHLHIILAAKSTSIYYIYNNDEIYENISISTKDDNDNYYFYIDGSNIATRFDESEYDGSVYRYVSSINTNSTKLTIYANTYKDILVSGGAQLVYQKIDNSLREVKKASNFVKGGTIVLPFGFDFDECFSRIFDVYEEYEKSNPEPEDSTMSDDANYFINFAKAKISDLADIINEATNDVKPITISLKDTPDKSNKNSTLILNRLDIPVTSLYINAVNKIMSSVCVQSGTIDLSKWSFKDADNIIKAFITREEKDYLPYYLPYIPILKNSRISGQLKLTNNNKCIGFQLTNVPSSSIEIFIYTTNTTFIEILSKIKHINVLTSSDLDAYSKLKNKNTRIIVVAVLDDLPDGKSINLNGIREDTNVILAGMKQDKIGDIYDFIQAYRDIEDEYSYDYSGEWNETLNNELTEKMNEKHVELYTQFASKYTNYQPKASINYDKVQSLIIASINYYGTHIKCTNFYPLASTFSNLNDIAKDFDAQITITESITYNLISSLELKDLVLFPVSTSPLNVMGIDQINFTESQWTLKLRAHLSNDGFKDGEIKIYPINVNKVKGQLFLYSISSDCEFNVPEKNNDKKQKLKGVSLTVNFDDNIDLNNIPGMVVLEDQHTDTKDNKNNKIKSLRKIIKTAYSVLNIPSLSKKHSKISKQAKMIKKVPKKNLLDSTSDAVEITFSGNWDNVESIDSLDIDTGKLPAVIESVPAPVAKVIDIKSESSVTLGTDLEDITVEKTQTISGVKSMSYSGNTKSVKFNELVFTGSMSQLTLLINDNPSKVIANNVVVESESSASVNKELEIISSLELGTGSSISSTSIKGENIDVKFNYRLSGRIPEIPNGISPKSITFNYIGESVGSTEVNDYSKYVDTENNQLTFESDEKCMEWKGKVTFKSDLSTEFDGKGKVVEPVCNKNVLAIKVIAKPKDESGSNNDEIDPPFNPDGSGDGPNGGNDGKGGNKGLNGGEIAGIVIGCVAFVAIVAVLIWYFVFHKKKDAGTPSSVGENQEE